MAKKQKAVFADPIFKALDKKDKAMTASIGRMDKSFRIHKKRGK